MRLPTYLLDNALIFGSIFLSLMGGPTLGLLTDLLDAKIDFISTNKVATKRPFLLEGGRVKSYLADSI